MSAVVHTGDCLQVMPTLAADSIDAIVTDPPYGLGFMGKDWDHGVPGAHFWTEALRVAKPGAFMLAFGGTRTYHRLACAIEDAGWEIRDCIMWCYGSGFPKSHNLDGERKGWGTALKPAYEPIIVARKPLVSACVNVLEVVESQLRERGVTGDIQWKQGNASDANRLRQSTNSGSIKLSERLATSAESVGVSETQNSAPRIRKSTVTHGTDGASHGQGGQGRIGEAAMPDCETPSSKPTAEGVLVVERQNETSSLSITSTEAGRNTENESTARYTRNCDATVSRKDIEFFAGIATGLTGSTETVRIGRDSEGAFLWPDGLPKYVRGSPLTVAANVMQYGTGALNIDGCRVSGDMRGGNQYRSADNGRRHMLGQSEAGKSYQVENNTLGRWPANFIHDGSDEVVRLFPQSDGQSGAVTGCEPSSKTNHVYRQFGGRPASEPRGDTGSAARFFYCAKASRADREDGCEGLNERQADSAYGNGLNTATKVRTSKQAAHGVDRGMRRNTHPTVKPTDLMRYLCRLVTPPGGTILDPFTGSGSTGRGAVLEGFNFVGIEREADFQAIATARIAAAERQAAANGAEQLALAI